MTNIDFHYDEAIHGRHAQLKKPTFILLGIVHWLLGGIFLYSYYVKGEGDNIQMFIGYGLIISGGLQFFAYMRALKTKIPEKETQYIKINDTILEYKHPDRSEAVMIPLDSLSDIQLEENSLLIQPKGGETLQLPLQFTDRKKKRQLGLIVQNIQLNLG